MTTIFGWKRVANEAIAQNEKLTTDLAVTETKLNAAERQISDMRRSLSKFERRTPDSHMTVRINNNELLSTKENYEVELRRHADASLRKYRDDIHGCFTLFDKILYQSSESIANGSYLNVLDTVAKLDVLSSYILNTLLGKPEVFSIWLYLTDTESMHRSLKEIPAINMEYPYLIALDDKTARRDVDFVEVRMTTNSLMVTSPLQNVEFPLHLRKTVLRVVYALFTKKYHLYHLWDSGSSTLTDSVGY